MRRQVPDAGRRSFQAVGSRGVSGLLRFTFWFPLALPFPIFVCLETLSSCLFAFLGQEFDRRCVVVWGCVCGCLCMHANAVSVVVRVLRTSFFSSPVSCFVLFCFCCFSCKTRQARIHERAHLFCQRLDLRLPDLSLRFSIPNPQTEIIHPLASYSSWGLVVFCEFTFLPAIFRIKR